MSQIVRRGFVDLSHGQMHYRYAGKGALDDDGVPLLIIHASPGSSRQQLALIADFAPDTQVFAPDTPGNGDSEPLGPEVLTVADMAAAYLAFLEARGLDRVHVYGSHTGAAIAAELAIITPGRVASVVLDGISVMGPDELADVMVHYAHPFTPDLEGTYLQRIFQFCRDQYLFFPWYKRDRAHQRVGGLPHADDLCAWVQEVLKGATTYHRNYRAAFQWDALSRLPLISVPALVMAGENDPLVEGTRQAASTLPMPSYAQLPRFDDPEFRVRRKAVMMTFYANSSRVGA